MIFAGNGDLKGGKLLSKKLNIENQVEFKGWVNGEKKHKLFSSSSIFCLPSYAEGFPMAILDAWVYGLPVLSTPVGGIPDIAVNGENILLFNPNDVEYLGTMLEQVIKDDALKTKLSKSAFNFAANQFSKENIELQIKKVYNDCFNNN